MVSTGKFSLELIKIYRIKSKGITMLRAKILLKMNDSDVGADSRRRSVGLHGEHLSNSPTSVTYPLDNPRHNH